MNGNFTPGPWRVLDGAILSEKLNSYGNWIIVSLERARTDEDEANLRLIAAAPQLLEACKMALPFLEEYRERVIKGEITGKLLTGDYAPVNDMRRAIMAAEGGDK